MDIHDDIVNISSVIDLLHINAFREESLGMGVQTGREQGAHGVDHGGRPHSVPGTHCSPQRTLRQVERVYYVQPLIHFVFARRVLGMQLFRHLDRVVTG